MSTDLDSLKSSLSFEGVFTLVLFGSIESNSSLFPPPLGADHLGRCEYSKSLSGLSLF